MLKLIYKGFLVKGEYFTKVGGLQTKIWGYLTKMIG